jgi:hypothetical protein
MITDSNFDLSGVRVALHSTYQLLFLDYDQVHTLLTQPIIVARIGSTWNFDRWKWAALSNAMHVEVFKPNDLFPSFCDYIQVYTCIIELFLSNNERKLMLYNTDCYGDTPSTGTTLFSYLNSVDVI